MFSIIYPGEDASLVFVCCGCFDSSALVYKPMPGSCAGTHSLSQGDSRKSSRSKTKLVSREREHVSQVTTSLRSFSQGHLPWSPPLTADSSPWPCGPRGLHRDFGIRGRHMDPHFVVISQWIGPGFAQEDTKALRSGVLSKPTPLRWDRTGPTPTPTRRASPTGPRRVLRLFMAGLRFTPLTPRA